jgi:hypothetical protein
MLNQVGDSTTRRQCMDARELAVPPGKFARHLMDLGHTPLSVAGYSDGARVISVNGCPGLGSARLRLTIESLPGSRTTDADARVYASIAVFPPDT